MEGQPREAEGAFDVGAENFEGRPGHAGVAGSGQGRRRRATTDEDGRGHRGRWLLRCRRRGGFRRPLELLCGR